MKSVSSEYYGAGSAIVDVLLKSGAGNFRDFFIGIKSGLKVEESLQKSYGVNFEGVAHLYGRTIGRPDLTP